MREEEGFGFWKQKFHVPATPQDPKETCGIDPGPAGLRVGGLEEPRNSGFLQVMCELQLRILLMEKLP